MWQKALFLIFLFYLFSLLQSSFFPYFNILGSVPNLVFILFFSIVFFDKKDRIYPTIIWAIIAGIFLDIFSYTRLGPSILSLVIVGFLLKKTQSALRRQEDNHPFVYFLPLFLVSFILYEFLLSAYMRFFDPSHYWMSFGLSTVGGIIYNLLFASLVFLVFKKILTNAKKV